MNVMTRLLPGFSHEALAERVPLCYHRNMEESITERRILLVEDDPAVYGEVERMLRGAGYEVVCGENGKNIDGDYDLALLDIKLPGASGYDICTVIRRRQACPIVFLTSMDDTESELRGFALGADDYIKKPFEPAVLLARIDRLLSGPAAGTISRCGIALDLSRMTAVGPKGDVLLARTEFLLLRALMESGGAVSRRALIERLWDSEEYINENTLNVSMSRLRNKLASVGKGGAPVVIPLLMTAPALVICTMISNFLLGHASVMLYVTGIAVPLVYLVIYGCYFAAAYHLSVTTILSPARPGMTLLRDGRKYDRDAEKR